jgi:hypothetical protein
MNRLLALNHLKIYSPHLKMRRVRMNLVLFERGKNPKNIRYLLLPLPTRAITRILRNDGSRIPR